MSLGVRNDDSHSHTCTRIEVILIIYYYGMLMRLRAVTASTHFHRNVVVASVMHDSHKCSHGLSHKAIADTKTTHYL